MVCKKFDEALLSAVDFAFRSLGKSCHRALYFHLKMTFRIRRVDIPDEVEEFDKAVRLIFGDGAVFLERLILEELCEGLEVRFKKKNPLGFVGAVSRVRSMVLLRESLFIVPDLNDVAVVTMKNGGAKV